MVKFIRSGRLPLNGVKDEDKTAIDHVPFTEWHVVDGIRYPRLFRDADSCKHGLLPEAAASFDCGDGVDNA
jgi:hypothetical protein